MSDKTMPADWVLLEAAKRGGVSSLTLDLCKSHYACGTIFAALCDMIAKHEQPPVDPDVEAVKRVLREWCPVYDEALFTEVDERVARAVAQYKLERAK